MTPKEFVRKLQEQPESTRKIIVWGVTIALGIALFVWWALDFTSSLQNNQNPSLSEQLQLESLQEEFNNIPINTNGTE